jgi:hypothetical protein
MNDHIYVTLLTILLNDYDNLLIASLNYVSSPSIQNISSMLLLSFLIKYQTLIKDFFVLSIIDLPMLDITIDMSH